MSANITNSNVVLLRTSVLNRRPNSLAPGQIAVNTNNGQIFLPKSYDGAVIAEAIVVETKTVIVATTAATILDSFPMGGHKTASYRLEITQNAATGWFDLWVQHNGSQVYSRQQSMNLNSEHDPIFRFYISASRVVLSIKNNNSTSTTIKMRRETMPQYE